MAIDERTRHTMYLGLEDKLGTEVADALMQHLPPVGWADVATKHDLDASVALLRSEIGMLGAGLRQELAERSQQNLRWTIGTLIAGNGVVVGAVVAAFLALT